MRLLFSITLLLLVKTVFAQELKTKNVIIITLDGYRWQELFEGADPSLLKSKYITDPNNISLFEGETSFERREKLMPFMWSVIARQGQLYGNRNYNNKVNCANNYLLSYPGYNEMFVGYSDRRINGNDPIVNPNQTVFEFIHRHNLFHNKVAAFATWDAFPYILREEQANILVNAGHDKAEGKISAKEHRLNAMQSEKRLDEHTFQYAMEYLKRERPRVMFLGFDETDQHGHGGQYDLYLKAAREADQRIAALWQWIQSQPDYRDQTTIFITTDHGRGMGKNSWRNHRLFAMGSRHIWFAVLGPDTPAFGELKFKGKYYQKQVAKTIAAFLGMPYQPKKEAGEVVQTMIGVPQPVVLESLQSSIEKEAPVPNR